MAYQQVQHSEHDKEMAKWEMLQQDVPRGLQPGNPWRQGNERGKAGASFPKMLYKADRIPPGLPGQGKFATSIAEPRRFGFRDEDEWNAAKQEAERFTTSCYTIVEDEDQLLKHKGQGWCESPKEAVELAESERIAIGNAKAESNWSDRRMSPAAIAEREAAEAESFGHLKTIPEKPVVRRVKKATKKAGKNAAA